MRTHIIFDLLPIEWVKRNPDLHSPAGPGGAFRPGQDSIGGEKTRIRKRLLGFRKAPVPDPFADNQRLAGSGQPKNFVTWTDERKNAS